MHYTHSGTKNCHPFLFHYSFYKCRPIYIIFGTHYIELICLAHRARQTIELLQRETPKFIPPDLWPPNSYDLNPVDYRIWGVMQDQTPYREVADLRQRLIDTWNDLILLQSIVDEWRKRPQACVNEKG